MKRSILEARTFVIALLDLVLILQFSTGSCFRKEVAVGFEGSQE